MSDDLIKQMEEFECDWRGGYGARLMKAARDRICELESRIATAEADALERAAKEVECGCKDDCLSPGNCSRDDAAAIRSLKPEASA